MIGGKFITGFSHGSSYLFALLLESNINAVGKQVACI